MDYISTWKEEFSEFHLHGRFELPIEYSQEPKERKSDNNTRWLRPTSLGLSGRADHVLVAVHASIDTGDSRRWLADDCLLFAFVHFQDPRTTGLRKQYHICRTTSASLQKTKRSFPTTYSIHRSTRPITLQCCSMRTQQL